MSNRFGLGVLAVSLALLCSCSSNRSIPTDDNSTLRISRTQILESLHSAAGTPLPTSYYSRGATIDVDGLSIPKLKANVYIKTGDELVTTMSMPFPPMEVGRLRVAGKSFSVRSKVADIDVEKSFPVPIIDYVEAVFCGGIPPLYTVYGEKDFSRFDCSIKNNRVVLRKLSPLMSSFIELDETMRMLSMQLSVNNDFIIIEPEDYKPVDNRLLPFRLRVKASIGGVSYSAELTHKSITLNDTKSLKY